MENDDRSVRILLKKFSAPSILERTRCYDSSLVCSPSNFSGRPNCRIIVVISAWRGVEWIVSRKHSQFLHSEYDSIVVMSTGMKIESYRSFSLLQRSHPCRFKGQREFFFFFFLSSFFLIIYVYIYNVYPLVLTAQSN